MDGYLKTIHSLGGEGRRRVGGSEMATRLHLAPASVTNMLQKFWALPNYKQGEGERLSHAGRTRALIGSEEVPTYSAGS